MTTSLTATAEVQINTSTYGAQKMPAAARLADGGFVAVWASNQSGQFDLYSQRYDVNGTKVGGEVQITSTTRFEQEPAVAGLADGGHIVVWRGYVNGSYHLLAQRYDVNGTKVGGEVTLSGTGAHPTSDRVAVTGLADGGYAVAFEASVDFFNSVATQRFTADGTAVGAPELINIQTFDGTVPLITKLADGGWVVAWDGYSSAWDGDSSGGSRGGWGQRFDAAGAKVGDEFQINSSVDELDPNGSSAVAALEDGGFVAVWRAWMEGGTSGVYAQRFDAAGAKVGTEFRVDTPEPGNASQPHVVGLAGGGFAVAWQSYQQDGGYDVHAQRFDAAGARVGSEFRLNDVTTGHQSDVVLVNRPDGGFTAVWTSNDQTRDPSGDGVFARTFTAPPVFIETIGTPDNDTLAGTAAREAIRGLAGHDTLLGGGGDDLLDGAAGADTLDGGAGADLLIGGTEADRFVFTASGSGNDTVADFRTGDLLVVGRAINGQSFASADDVLARAQVVNGSTVVDLGGGHTVVLTGIVNLTAADIAL
ncbi:MAG TPA: hypothetical protein VEY95_05915, partial [Azospirillaceae bacterium]|nr:hypothetical protein [Azospirillaceae bacterium]